jgi:hypothetical protein
MTAIQQPFSNVQLELLHLYSKNVSDDELLLLRNIIANFFADRATQLADKVWEEKNLDAKKLLKKHRRRTTTPSVK